MRRPKQLALAAAVAGALAGSVLAALAPLARDRGPSSLYERALERHVWRAQEELQESLELWQDRGTWENAWRVRTEHYEVRTTVSRAFGLELAQGLETMLAHFRRVLGVDYAPPEPFRVFVFPDLTAYNAFGDQFGAEHSSFYGSFYADQSPERPVATMVDANRTQLSMWVTHSALHQFLSHAFSRQPPLWVSEGLASYFALFWDYGWGVRELERIRADERLFVGVSDLLAGQPGAYTDRTHGRLVELGMLFTYLLAYREDTRTQADGSAPFAEYLQALLAGRDTSGSPVRELMTAGRAELEAALRTFEFEGG